MGQNEMKFCLDQKVEFKKSIGLYRQILLSYKTKVSENIIYFKCYGQKWMKFSKYLRNFFSQLSKI